MGGIYDDELIGRLRAGAVSVLPGWGIGSDAEVSLLTVSENATFVATDPENGAKLILRVHRPGYHTRSEIESELAWINALRAADVVATPKPRLRTDGSLVAEFDHDGVSRHVVAFDFMTGDEPAAGDGLVDGFFKLGVISARLHHHAKQWSRSVSFVRKSWTFDTTLGATPHWGNWRAARGLGEDGLALLEKVCRHLNQKLLVFGMGREKFGLIHADLRLANLLVDADRLGVIDFDDCGFGWFGYDFAAAISFIELDPIVQALKEAWVEGYRTIAPFSSTDYQMLESFVMLRRLLLTAWIASHPETPTAQEMGPGFTAGTIAMAQTYLSAEGA
ncbi:MULTISPECIES: phosphotransferase enzyme family protein [Thalassospira]|uniref:Aminoglycoside phosphotransferase n=2 Tax=Thalassospira TaxID=168934 RepID=A0A367W7R6_9PROT|nr:MULTISPECIES: phosphotransferase [Thalassospira]MDG4720527.1 phosphotransferase [Thalassospira sp. FZY0004]RCK37494.1 aminoglycoside phosphotransferase [Thalassospira profundimaris]